jgi:hypothetical protein
MPPTDSIARRTPRAGLLRRDSPKRIVADIRDSFWQMMRAGWKLWPFVHIVTYTMIPTRFKLLWVDMVEVRSDPSNLGHVTC